MEVGKSERYPAISWREGDGSRSLGWRQNKDSIVPSGSLTGEFNSPDRQSVNSLANLSTDRHSRYYYITNTKTMAADTDNSSNLNLMPPQDDDAINVVTLGQQNLSDGDTAGERENVANDHEPTAPRNNAAVAEAVASSTSTAAYADTDNNDIVDVDDDDDDNGDSDDDGDSDDSGDNDNIIATNDNIDDSDSDDSGDNDNIIATNDNSHSGSNNNSYCSCRKSKCILLYCNCFHEGVACQDDCKCFNCKNPKGVNVNSKPRKHREVNDETEQQTTTKKKKKRKKARIQKDIIPSSVAAATSSVSIDSTTQKPKVCKSSLVMLTVSPGRLGITLEKNNHDKIGGAVITNIDPTLCTFLHLIEVGDRIFTIDGKRVTRLVDVILGKDRERQFGILKKAVADAMMKENDKQLVGNENSSNASPTKLSKSNDTVDPSSSREGNHSTTVVATNYATTTTPGKKQFPLLTAMNAHTADRPSERLREDLMTELLQWDKKHDKKVSI